MNDVYPRTTVNDLTFILPSRRSRDSRTDRSGRATIIRPGMLTATDSLEAHYRRYLDQAIHKGKLVAPLVEEWMRPEIDATTKAGSPAVAPHAKAARYAGLIALAERVGVKLAGYWHVIADGNWRAFFSAKHKQYSVDQGVRLRAATFQLQSAALVFAAVMVLASAHTFAPSGAPRTADTPMVQPIRLTSDTAPANGNNSTTNASGPQGAGMSMRINNGNTSLNSNGWWSASAGATSAGVSGGGTAVPTTDSMSDVGGSAPTTPTTPLVPVSPSEPTTPVVTLPPVIADPIPTDPEEPTEPVIIIPDPVVPTPPADPPLLEGVVDGVTGTMDDVTGVLGGVVDGLL